MTDRIRKAWSVGHVALDGRDVVYAASAGKARYGYWLRVTDCWPDCRLIDIVVHRAAGSDIRLPPRDALADRLTARQIDCMLHAYGATGNPVVAGYRNHYVTAADDPPLVGLVDLGLMRCHAPNALTGGDACFTLTARGQHVALSLTPVYAP